MSTLISIGETRGVLTPAAARPSPDSWRGAESSRGCLRPSTDLVIGATSLPVAELLLRRRWRRWDEASGYFAIAATISSSSARLTGPSYFAATLPLLSMAKNQGS